ncbi:MAG TPA: hypothetical protein VGE90_08350 [Chitinophaga sp.]
MRTFTFLLLLLSIQSAAQQHIAQFVVWKPKAGLEQQFEKGYRQHLQWHKANRDPWAWYGWFIVSGPRDGQFVDATMEHAWSDFDHQQKPADDRADNELHVYPFADLQTVVKAVRLPALCTGDISGLQSKFLRMVTLQVTDISSGIKVLEQLKRSWPSATPVKNLLVYKIADGGAINELLLLWGFNSFEEYGNSEQLQEALGAVETALKVKAVKAITSETLVYRADMSLFPD